ncbi:hypothetical protein ACFC7A_19605 [Streptomyces niveus]|uniref:hypothetical protein n=1 Tax=Streptomyces niveus TaxID=193462 RepID=UPI0035D8CD33
MNATGAPEENTGGEPVGRCYTKARRAPLVHGVIRDVNGGRGLRLPGGPYTLTQLAAIVATVALLILSRPLWGGHGLADAVVLVALPFAAAFLLRQMHVDGRNPAAAAASVVMMLTGPRSGQLHRRPLRQARPRRTGALVTLGTGRADANDRPPAPPSTRAPRPSVPTAPSPAGPDAHHTGPGPGAPVASGVQALLARRAASAARSDLGD